MHNKRSADIGLARDRHLMVDFVCVRVVAVASHSLDTQNPMSLENIDEHFVVIENAIFSDVTKLEGAL